MKVEINGEKFLFSLIKKTTTNEIIYNIYNKPLEYNKRESIYIKFKCLNNKQLVLNANYEIKIQNKIYNTILTKQEEIYESKEHYILLLFLIINY